LSIEKSQQRLKICTKRKRRLYLKLIEYILMIVPNMIKKTLNEEEESFFFSLPDRDDDDDDDDRATRKKIISGNG